MSRSLFFVLSLVLVAYAQLSFAYYQPNPVLQKVVHAKQAGAVKGAIKTRMGFADVFNNDKLNKLSGAERFSNRAGDVPQPADASKVGIDAAYAEEF